MSFFRKLGQSIAPTFRKLPTDIGRFGRKLSTGASSVERGLEKASDIVGRVDKWVPNPITKAIKAGLDGGANVAQAVSKGGSALDLASRGKFDASASLAKQGFGDFKAGVSKGLSVAPLIM